MGGNFRGFSVSESSVKVFSAKFCGRTGLIQDFTKGANLEYVKKRGSRLFVAAGQPQEGGYIWKFKGG